MARLVRLVCVLMLLVMNCEGSALSKVQICGAHLAEAIRVVCNGRGYNVAFRPETNGGSRPSYDRRFKRGIVDECCRQGCSIGTLESYCSAPSTQNPNNLQIRKRSEIAPGKTLERDPTQDTKRTLGRDAPKQGSEKFGYEVNDLIRDKKSSDGNEDETSPQHHRRRLFGHSSGELKMRHPNRFFSLNDEHRHQGSAYNKHGNKHREGTAANKVKRNDVGKKTFDGLEGEYPQFGYDPFSGLEDDFPANSGDEINLIPNGHSGTAATAETPVLRHHKDRFLAKDKKQKIDNRNKKGKVDEAAETGASSQVGTIAPYFLGRTLVLPSSRKGFIPQL